MVGGLKGRRPFANTLFRFADGLLDYDPALLDLSTVFFPDLLRFRFVSLGFEYDEARNGYQIDGGTFSNHFEEGINFYSLGSAYLN